MQKIKILIVDDASFMRDIVRKGVRSQYPGFATKEAADGSQAKNILSQEDFDLILCDWEMPKMTGEELLAWLRTEGPKPETPFIMITSRGDKDHVVKALSLKANNYVVKPFTNEKLSEVITKQLCQSLGLKPDKLRQLGASSATGVAPGNNDAMSLLTGGTKTVKAADSEEDKVLSAKPKEQSIAQIRWKDLKTKCLIKEINMNSVTAVIRGDNNIPSIMELVVFDLVTNGGKDISRINGYTYQLQARETNAESEFVNITLRFIDGNDPDKQAHLERYISSLK
ncbi:response regulator [sulfur-oxidizing endosymbiont of Gigantopelta aegis]|uniref:response regulator n=1 Tax=sulfur-oxidizing endosymbiont of Gigantopelta aegis TaxID=2794934 RepID=UPI0018DE2B00|nr:response regulator [sulfur-oxidizing endosymbiont of Gigantopelta aegis]